MSVKETRSEETEYRLKILFLRRHNPDQVQRVLLRFNTLEPPLRRG
jgi:hypothetical protein